MPQREFDITIGANGQVQVHVQGYQGKGCLDAIQIFEQIVGQVTDRRETHEFYEPDEQVRTDLRQQH
jgi:hypothetical protein